MQDERYLHDLFFLRQKYNFYRNKCPSGTQQVVKLLSKFTKRNFTFAKSSDLEQLRPCEQ